MASILEYVVEIREGEGRIVALMFAYFASIMASYYCIKPATRSLYIKDLGVDNLPYVYIVTALLIGFVVTMLEKFLDRLDRVQIVTYLSGFFAANLVLMRGLLYLDDTGISAAVFYVWADIFSVMVVTLFWAVANETFNPEQGKRLYGFIGAGATVGGFFGGQISGQAVQFIGTENLLFLSAALLVFPPLIIRSIGPGRTLGAKKSAVPSGEQNSKKGSGKGAPGTADPKGGMQLIAESSYLQLMVVSLGLVLTVSLFVEQQLYWKMEQTIQDTDKQTEYLASLAAWINAPAFFTQIFLTGRILKGLGVLPAMLILPLVNLSSAVVFIAFPVLGVIFVARALDGCLKYGVNQVTKEVLYLPTTREVKYKAKAFIDMFFYRAVKGLAALLILFSTKILHFDAGAFSYLVVVLAAAWVFASLALYRGYRGALGDRVEELAMQGVDKPLVKGEDRRGLSTELTYVLKDAAVADLVPNERTIGQVVEGLAQAQGDARFLSAYRLCRCGQKDPASVGFEFLEAHIPRSERWIRRLVDPGNDLETRFALLIQNRDLIATKTLSPSSSSAPDAP